MKYLILLSPLTIQANTSKNDAFTITMQNLANEETPTFRKYTQIVDLIWHKLENHENFNIDNLYISDDKKNLKKNLVAMIENYGCHCFPTNKSLVGGKGAPRDALDNACRALSRCHKCVEMDFLDEDTFEPICQPDTDGYKYTLVEENREIICEESPRHHVCTNRQCQCDRQFAETVFDLFTNQNQGEGVSDWNFNPSFWLNNRYIKEMNNSGLDNQLFDFESSCATTNEKSSANDACCGDYPLRRPYSSSKKQCCNNLVIHPLFKECCEEGAAELGSGCF